MLELLTVIYKWKWHIAIFCITAVLLSVIFSGPKFMPPYFESQAVFYPSNPAATDRASLFSEAGSERMVSYFGSRSDINRMLAIANSSGLVNSMIRKHGLVEHYGLDTANKKHMVNVTLEFKGNYEAIKTDKEAIRVRVFDRDPEKAADMVNDIVAHIDMANNQMIRDNKEKTLKILREELKRKQKELEETGNSGSILSKEIEKNLLKEIADLKILSDQYEVSANESFTSIYMIESAVPALIKSKPVRWKVVLLTAVGAFIFSILSAVMLEKFNEVKANVG